MHDVIIVGAGPAGSVLAALLAAQGVKVLVLERESLPRRKPCGESLNPGAVAALARVLPAGKFAAILSSMEHSLIHGWRLTSGKAELLASFPAGQFGMACAREKAGLCACAACWGGWCEGHRTNAGAASHLGARACGWCCRLFRSGSGSGISGAPRYWRRWDSLSSGPLRGLSSFGPLRKTAFTARVSGVRDLQPRVELFTGRGLVVGLAPIGGGEANMTLAQLSGDGSAAAVAAGLKESGAVKNEAGHADMDTYTATDTQMETLEAASFFVNVSGKAPASCDGTVRASAPAEADNRAASAKSKEGALHGCWERRASCQSWRSACRVWLAQARCSPVGHLTAVCGQRSKQGCCSSAMLPVIMIR